MKDENDHHTAEIIHLAPKVPDMKLPDRDMKLPDVARPVPKRTAEQIANSAVKRERQGLESWLPVSFFAEQYSMSTRRVRILLSSGRLEGRRLENGYWEVKYPLTVTMGRRGPPIFGEARKKLDQMKEQRK